ncbi:MAG: hypothetical protein P8Y70_06315 [Candidatus Lokiarchaeota archaeon]
MGLQILDPVEILHGVFTFSFIAISIIIGLIFLLKYWKEKRIEIITLGLAWIFLSSAWWGSGFSFFLILINLPPLNEFFFLLIANFFIPFALVFWMYSFTYLVYPPSKKLVTLIFSIILVIFEILLIIFIFEDRSLVGRIQEASTFYYMPGIFTLIFQLFAVIITIVTGIIFSIRSLKSHIPKVKWKGRFLLGAFILFAFGSFLDAVIHLNSISLIIVRVLLILSSIGYYLGFLLPDKILQKLTTINKEN